MRTVPKLPWLLRSTPVQRIAVAISFGICIFAIAFISDWLTFSLHPIINFIVGDALTAVIAAALALTLVSRASERRRVVHERLEMVAELNHHIRNALEVIQMSVHTTKDKQAIAIINEAAERIQLALREILNAGGKPRKKKE
ncbi:MAG: hypothetical protein ACE14M_01115 [Terriglobales bacterium]